MASDTENVGGLSISLEIDDSKSDSQLNELENRLSDAVRPRKASIEVSAPGLDSALTKIDKLERGASRKGGTTSGARSDNAETRLVAAVTKLSASLANLKIVIDPNSIAAISKAVRDAVSGGVGGMTPASGPPERSRGGASFIGSAWSRREQVAADREFDGSASRFTNAITAERRIRQTLDGPARSQHQDERPVASARPGGTQRPYRSDPYRTQIEYEQAWAAQHPHGAPARPGAAPRPVGFGAPEPTAPPKPAAAAKITAPEEWRTAYHASTDVAGLLKSGRFDPGKSLGIGSGQGQDMRGSTYVAPDLRTARSYEEALRQFASAGMPAPDIGVVKVRMRKNVGAAEGDEISIRSDENTPENVEILGRVKDRKRKASNVSAKELKHEFCGFTTRSHLAFREHLLDPTSCTQQHAFVNPQVGPARPKPRPRAEFAASPFGPIHDAPGAENIPGWTPYAVPQHLPVGGTSSARFANAARQRRLEMQSRKALARDVHPSSLGPHLLEPLYEKRTKTEPRRNVGRLGDKPDRPEWLTRDPILNQIMEDIEQETIGPSYKLVDPSRVDLDQVPGRESATRKRAALEGGRWLSHQEMAPVLEALPRGTKRGQFRVPPGFGFMSGQKVQQVTTPERIKEELVLRTGADPDAIPTLAAIEDLASYSRQIRPWMAQHAIDEKPGALMRQGVARYTTPERVTKSMQRVGGLTHRAERERAKWSNIELGRRREREGGYTSEITGERLDRGAAQYVQNMFGMRIEGKDIGQQDPEITHLANMLFRRSLGPRENRRAQRTSPLGIRGPDYQNTDLYPVTSDQDIRDYMYGRRGRTQGHLLDARLSGIALDATGNPREVYGPPAELSQKGAISSMKERLGVKPGGRLPGMAGRLFAAAGATLRANFSGVSQRQWGIEPRQRRIAGMDDTVYNAELDARRDERQLAAQRPAMAEVGMPRIEEMRELPQAPMLKLLEERRARLRWEQTPAVKATLEKGLPEEIRTWDVEADAPGRGKASLGMPSVWEPAVRGPSGHRAAYSTMPEKPLIPGQFAQRFLGRGQGAESKTAMGEPLGETLEENAALRAKALEAGAAYPETAAFKGLTVKRQRAARYEAHVAQYKLLQQRATEAEQTPPAERTQEQRELIWATKPVNEYGYKVSLGKMGDDLAKEREALSAAEPEADTPETRIAKLNKKRRSELDRVVREHKRAVGENPTLEDDTQLVGKKAVINNRYRKLIEAEQTGTPVAAPPSVAETMAAVEAGVPHPDVAAAVAMDDAGGTGRRRHRRRAAPESFVAAGGPGGPSAGTPGGGMVSVSGVVDVRIVDSIALTIANPTALRPEKVAAAATGTAAATTAAKTPAVPEGATAYGPKEARPVVAAGPVDKRGETIRMLGEVLPAARQAERAAGTARGARQKNLRAGGRASLTGMQMQQTAEAAVQKEEADAKAAADKARAAEAKRFAALPFSKRVEEVAQKHLEDLRNSSTYMPPATGVAAAPIRPFNPATSAVEERGARLLAMREELAPLGLRPSEIEDRTWTDKARALAAQHAPGTREPWRPALVRGTIKREFKKNVIAKGVKDEWGPGDEEAFYSRIFTDAGIADLPAPPRAPGTARTPMAARAMGADKQLTNAMRRLGITPAPVDQEKAARGLEYPNEEGGEPLDPYEFLRRNVATAQSKRGELSSRALSTMGVQYVGRKFGPWGRIHQREVELTAATTKAKGEVGEYKTLRGEYEAQAPIVMGLRTSARAPGATAEDKASFVELRRRFLDLGKATHAQAKVANDAVMAQAELSAKITTTGDTVQHFGASFAGGVVGGFVGAMAGMIAQPLIQGVSQAVAQIGGPIVDSLLGWQMTQAKTTGAISQTTQAQAGFGQAAVAAQYQTISPTLLNAGAGGQAGFNAVGEQSRVMAANEKLVAYRDYLRTKKNIGTGATPALTEASGGILGGWIGAERKHTAEVINSMVPDLGRVEATKTINELLGGATGKPEYQFRETEATGYEASNPDVRAQWAWEQANGMEAVAGNRMVLVDAAGNIVSAGKAASAFASSLTSATKAVDKTNPEEYIRANENQIQAQIGGLEAQKQYTLDTSIPMQRGMNWLTSPQLPFGTSWMPGTQGNTPGFPSPTLVDQYSKEMQPFVGEAQGKVGAIPAGLGPMGYTFEGGLEASKYKIPADATQSFNQYKQVGQSAFKAVQDAAEAGIQTMLKAGVPAATINSLREYGAQAIALRSAIAAVQVGRSETKYQHDLAIANRALGDARQLTGQIGKNNSDNVGYYERQLLLINRASTALSLQLQQRQITTQQAIAGFAVQGDTPEIRMARRREAMLAADIANKQLDYSKQAFGTEIKLVDATNMRQLKDTAYALSDLKLDRQAALFTAGLQNALALVQAAVESITPEVAAYTGFFDSINSLQREMAVQIAAITGANVKTMITTVEDAIAGLVSRFPWLFGTAGITANAPSQAPGGEHSGTSGEQTPRPEDSRYRPGTAPVAPRYGPRDRAIWGARLGITPKSAAGGRGADMGNPSAGSAFPNPVAVTTNNTTNNNQKIEISPVYNITLPSLDQEQVADLTTKVVKSINTALALVGLRPVAR